MLYMHLTSENSDMAHFSIYTLRNKLNQRLQLVCLFDNDIVKRHFQQYFSHIVAVS